MAQSQTSESWLLFLGNLSLTLQKLANCHHLTETSAASPPPLTGRTFEPTYSLLPCCCLIPGYFLMVPLGLTKGTQGYSWKRCLFQNSMIWVRKTLRFGQSSRCSQGAESEVGSALHKGKAATGQDARQRCKHPLSFSCWKFGHLQSNDQHGHATPWIYV